MYVSEICAEGIFVTFPWWLKNVKSRSKIALFSNERHFEIWFPKKKTIRFFEVNYLNYTKKTQFCMWQPHYPQNKGETRTSHGPIPHPLMFTMSNVPCTTHNISDMHCSKLATTIKKDFYFGRFLAPMCLEAVTSIFLIYIFLVCRCKSKWSSSWVRL